MLSFIALGYLYILLSYVLKTVLYFLYHSGKLGSRNKRKRCWNKPDPFLSFTSRCKESDPCDEPISVVAMWFSLTLFHLFTCKEEYSRKTAPLSYLVRGLEGMLKVWRYEYLSNEWMLLQSSETLGLLFSLN